MCLGFLLKVLEGFETLTMIGRIAVPSSILDLAACIYIPTRTKQELSAALEALPHRTSAYHINWKL